MFAFRLERKFCVDAIPKRTMDTLIISHHIVHKECPRFTCVFVCLSVDPDGKKHPMNSRNTVVFTLQAKCEHNPELKDQDRGTAADSQKYINSTSKFAGNDAERNDARLNELSMQADRKMCSR